MAFNIIAAHGLESSGTDVQSEARAVHTPIPQRVQHRLVEMQTGGGPGAVAVRRTPSGSARDRQPKEPRPIPATEAVEPR